ncbi:hypothetical protein NDU88_004404 [Pleurodeles waltl]|uniref:Uncharacterized protein n=1 Tax=Pleurodeles waltl TaxID=8319 RepID=A0AAV7SIN5_PLEWA|nr:hypothetical protein NDU88_004404 [Pleurodeles waltl]
MILGGRRGRGDSQTSHCVRGPPLPQQRRRGLMPGDPAGAGQKAENSRLAPGGQSLQEGRSRVFGRPGTAHPQQQGDS